MGLSDVQNLWAGLDSLTTEVKYTTKMAATDEEFDSSSASIGCVCQQLTEDHALWVEGLHWTTSAVNRLKKMIELITGFCN